MLSTRAAFALAVTLVLIPGYGSAAIQITGYTDATNDRFTNSPSFIAAPYDLSGVGQNAGGAWATLISPNVIVSANHARPSGDVFFYAGNDPTSTALVRQITGVTQRIGNSDLWLARLSSPVDGSIAIYDFARIPLVGPPAVGNTIFVASAGVYQNDNGFVFGQSPTPRSGSQSQAVGRNLISGYAEDVNFLDGKVDTLILRFEQPGDPSFVPYEALVQGGDSGAPFFVDEGGTLQLLGINSFQLQNTASGAAIGSGINYIGNYQSDVDAFIAASAVAVPEPSVCGLAAAGLATAVWHRRRHRIARSRVSA